MVESGSQWRGERAKRMLLLAAIGAAGLLVGFLVGYVLQVSSKRDLQASLDMTRQELETERAALQLHGLQTRVGAALSEASRGNYERARQLMSTFYQELDSIAPSLDAATQEVIRVANADRDSMITLLSRAAPESVARLNMLYTRLYTVFDRFGRQSPNLVSPLPRDTAPAASTR